MHRKIAFVRGDISMLSEQPTKLSIVESCSLFNSLDPNEREKLINSSYTAFAERGESIWTAGSPSDFIGAVGIGFVKVTKSTATGQEVAMDMFGPGQLFGLLAAIEGRTFPLTATAVTNCWYLKIPTPILQETYQNSSPIKDQIIRMMGPRMRRAHEMMARLSTGRVEERVAAVLFILADSYGTETPTGKEIAVPLTRQDISEMAGTTVETAIRILSKWQKEGLVTTDKHIITLRDSRALACFMTS